MKTQRILGILVLAASLMGCASEHSASRQAKLKAIAKFPEADARSIALAQVPNGSIKEGELEREHGRLIWSFDMTAPGIQGVKEINIDAMDGSIVSIENEKE